MDNTQLKNLINSKIVENNNGEITASDLNIILNEILDSAEGSSGVSDYNDLDNNPLENTEEGGIVLHGYTDDYGTYSNTANAQNAVALGANNTVSGDNSFSTGVNNSITGQFNSAFGDQNTIIGGGGNFVSGSGNTLGSGNQSTIFGASNIFNNSGTNLFVAGYNNTVDPDFTNPCSDSVILGTRNILGANSVYILGYSNNAKGSESSILGANLETNNYHEVALGQYNKSNSQTTKFSIGCGSGASDRLNAIEIDAEGKVYIKGIGGYDGTNITNTSIKSVSDILENVISVTTGTNAIVGGNGATATAPNAIAFGTNAKATSSEGIAIGTNTQASYECAAIGYNNKALSSNNYVFGQDNDCTSGINVFMFGKNLEASVGNMQGGTVVLGKYNKASNGWGKYISFQFGNGSSSKRKNAITIDVDDNIYITGIGNYKGEEDYTYSGANKVESLQTVINNIPKIQIVDAMPSNPTEGILYLVKEA